MIKKVVRKRRLTDTSVRDDLAFWLSRPPEERVAAVEILRRQHYGSMPRLKKVARVVNRKPR
jgi:hypothetical protein